MNSPNENNMWIRLYKNRLSFIDTSVDEYLAETNLDSLLIDIDDNKKSKVDICKMIVKKFSGKATRLEKSLEEELEGLHNKLEVNENKFIDELTIQDKLSQRIKGLKDEEKRFGKVINSEMTNLTNGFEKIFNHLDDTMNRVEEKGLKNILDRKGFKVVELLECFKKNLYKYFMSSIEIFKNPSCESDIEMIIENKISKELDPLESDLVKHLFEEYISEFQWKEIIENAKKHARDYINICDRYVLEASLIVEDELKDKIKQIGEGLENSISRVDEIKDKRFSMEKKLGEVNSKYENLLLNNEEEINELKLFKERIRINYVKEYNKIAKLINNKTTINKDLRTYYEYLYLITSEMEKLEGELYG